MKPPTLHLASGPGRLELLRLVLHLRLRDLRQRWRRRFPPRRRVVDHACPILRWDAGQVVTVFMERLDCGHLLPLTARPRPKRACWKCDRGLPPDSRLRVRPSHRTVLGPGRIDHA
jgi:hypothetical protein